MNYLVAGRTPKRTGNAHPNIQPQQVFACSDGDIVAIVGNDTQFQKLCMVLGRPELAADARFQTNASRVQHQEILLPQVEAAFATGARNQWIARLTEAGVPCGPINSIPEVFEDPQVKERGMLRYLPHAAGADVPQVVSPFKFMNAELEYKRPPPMLGQHTDEVLRELDFDDTAIAGLRERGVV
jgi:crotonobetainyl-CoA:carnitine CoA-transferase CaiB-like acyl-CoA transferase